LSLVFSTAFAQVGRIIYLDFNNADANEVKSLIGEKTKKFIRSKSLVVKKWSISKILVC